MPTRYVTPYAREFADDGLEVGAGYKLNFYAAGTTTRQDTYSDIEYATANENPVVADSDGRFPDIWMVGSYKVILTDADGVQIWSADNVSGVGGYGDAGVFATAQDLRDFGYVSWATSAKTLGAVADNDNGGGSWRWDAGSTDADDLITTIQPTGHAGAGRWKRPLFEGGIVDSRRAGFGAPGNTPAENSTALEAAIAALPSSGDATGGTVWIPPGRHSFTGISPSVGNLRLVGAGAASQRADDGSSSAPTSVLEMVTTGWAFDWGTPEQQRYDAPEIEGLSFRNGPGSGATGGLRFKAASHGKLTRWGVHGFPIGVQFLGLDETGLAQRECQYWDISSGSLYKCGIGIDFWCAFSMKVFGLMIQGENAAERSYPVGSIGIKIHNDYGYSDSIRLFGVNSQMVETAFLIDGTNGGAEITQKHHLIGCRAEACLYGVRMIKAVDCQINLDVGNAILDDATYGVNHGTGVSLESGCTRNYVRVGSANNMVDEISDDKTGYHNEIITRHNSRINGMADRMYRAYKVAATFNFQTHEPFTEWSSPSNPGTCNLPDADDPDIDGMMIKIINVSDPANICSIVATGTNEIKFGDASVTTLELKRNVIYTLRASNNGGGFWYVEGWSRAASLPLLSQTISGPTIGEVQAISNKVDVIISRLIDAQVLKP